jgi:hypothetical protein
MVTIIYPFLSTYVLPVATHGHVASKNLKEEEENHRLDIWLDFCSPENDSDL